MIFLYNSGYIVTTLLVYELHCQYIFHRDVARRVSGERETTPPPYRQTANFLRQVLIFSKINPFIFKILMKKEDTLNF